MPIISLLKYRNMYIHIGSIVDLEWIFLCRNTTFVSVEFFLVAGSIDLPMAVFVYEKAILDRMNSCVDLSNQRYVNIMQYFSQNHIHFLSCKKIETASRNISAWYIMIDLVENFVFSDRIHTTVTDFIIPEPTTWIVINREIRKEARWNIQE